jgi:flagellar motor switch protein FliG
MRSLSSKEKAAAVLIALGPELSARVLKHLREQEVEELALEVANLESIDSGTREQAIQEFCELYRGKEYMDEGGLEYAKEMLDEALGSNRSSEILNRLNRSIQMRPFDFVRKTDPGQLLNFIQGEHPQTIALILAYLEPQQSSVILSALPPERQTDVVRRVAIMDRTSPDIIKEVEAVLERKLSTLMDRDYTSVGGIESTVDLLNNVDRGTEKAILENLNIHDPELTDEIRKRLFVFDDIVLLDDRSVQHVLGEIDLGEDLPIALKVASDEVTELIKRNLSSRAQQDLDEAMEYLGPVRLRDVEEAQQRIVATIRELDEAGEIIIQRGEDQVVV